MNIKSLQNPEDIALSTSGGTGRHRLRHRPGNLLQRERQPSDLPALPGIRDQQRPLRLGYGGVGNITFQTGAGKDKFTSINPDQDSLTFTARSAVYDNTASELAVGGVPYVISADARIIPSDSSLIIRPGAVIAELTNARIIADTANQYHVINRATVKHCRSQGVYRLRFLRIQRRWARAGI